MKTDLKNCPPEADIETAFDRLNTHMEAIKIIEAPYNIYIKEIDDKIDAMIEELMDERRALESDKTINIETHVEAIEILTTEIKEMVLQNKKSCSTEFGTCTYVKGRKASVNWNDAALMGYAAANPANESILQFRTEGTKGKPSTRFKFIEME